MAVKEMRMCYILNLNMCIPFALHTKRYKVTPLELKGVKIFSWPIFISPSVMVPV